MTKPYLDLEETLKQASESLYLFINMILMHVI